MTGIESESWAVKPYKQADAENERGEIIIIYEWRRKHDHLQNIVRLHGNVRWLKAEHSKTIEK